MTTLYTDNFDATAPGTLPTGWASLSGGWQVSGAPPASGHTKSFTSSAAGDGNIAVLNGITASADAEVLFQFVAVAFSGSSSPNPGPILRMSGDGANGYVALLGGGSSPGFYLFRKVGGFSVVTSGASGLTLATGDIIKCRARIIGSSIKVRWWKASGAEPSTWTIDATDDGVAAAGYPGFYYATDGVTSPAFGVTDMTVTDAQAAQTGTTIAPNDPAVVYSPGNWDVQTARALTINAGAYLRTLFTGATCKLTFDVSALQAPLPQITYRIDDGPETNAPLAASMVLALPAETAAWGQHLLEVRVKATTETQARWAGTATAVRLTGIVIDQGGTVALPGVAPLSGVALGDSITEGVRTLNMTAANDTDRNDAAQGWAWELARLLGAEIGIVGFGATGWNQGGSGGVPALTSTYDKVLSGVARTFAGLDFVIINMGTNDGSANTVANVTAVLNGLLTACPPKTKIFILRPFNGVQAANLLAGIAACSDPTRVVYVDTAGFWSSTDASDSLHPYGFANRAKIAPKLAAAIKPNLGARRFTINVAA